MIIPLAEEFSDNFNDLDDILAENFSPEPAKIVKGNNSNNVDSLEFDNSDDLNNIIEKYESMLNQPSSVETKNSQS